MAAKEIIYFEKAGKENTAEVIKAVKERARELGIKHIVVASTSGETGAKFWGALKGTGVTLISVASHAGARGGDALSVSQEKRKELEDQGVKVLLCSHALSGVERSISEKFGGISRVEIIAHVLRRFGCDGLKVAVEVAVMAADAGLVPTDREIIAVGGTKGGSDCAIVLKAAHMNNFFDLEIREFIAKPRQRG